MRRSRGRRASGPRGEDKVNDVAIPDEGDGIVDCPAWSRTLLLLLDYAIIEGAHRELNVFVRLLELARKDLEDQVAVPSPGADSGNASLEYGSAHPPLGEDGNR